MEDTENSKEVISDPAHPPVSASRVDVDGAPAQSDVPTTARPPPPAPDNDADVGVVASTATDDAPAPEGPEYGPAISTTAKGTEESTGSRDLTAEVTTSTGNASGSVIDKHSRDELVKKYREAMKELDHVVGMRRCRSVDCFRKLNHIDEGAYGVVYRAQDKETGEVVALKRVKMDVEMNGFPLTALREVHLLLSLCHPNILKASEVVVGTTLNEVFMVLEFMDHDLKALMDEMKVSFTQSEVKCLLRQLLEALKYMQENWVIHRDLKTSNLLYNNQGYLKVGDFGLARHFEDPLRDYTAVVVTLWYRAPELLLGTAKYSSAIDMWAVGCIFAELLIRVPLFPGKDELDQLNRIFRELGTPNDTIWPGFSDYPVCKKVNFTRHKYNELRKRFPLYSHPFLSDKGFDLLNRMLTYDPEKRITAQEALAHDYFRESPLPQAIEMMPTFPSTNESSSKQKRRIERQYEEESRKRALGIK